MGGYLEWFKRSIPKGWQVPGHVIQIASALDMVDAGEIDRLAISMPPRHGKSETITCRYPLYWLERNLADNCLITGYNERFARKFSRRVRNAALERGIVALDKSATDEWATHEGGMVMARGVGNPPTGTGFKRIIIDDPIKNREQADSEAYRDKCWDWFSEDLNSRLEPGGAIIMVATRWHHDDIISRAIESEPDKWTVLNLPAINEDDEPLWPERYTLAALRRIQRLNPTAFEALYQGKPTPREGDLFKVGKLDFCDRSDIDDNWPSVCAIDLASSSSKKSDWTALAQAWRGPDGRFYISVRRIQAGMDNRNKWLKRQLLERGQRVLIPQDPGSAGVDAALSLARLLAPVVTEIHTVTGSKESRAEPLASQVDAKNVTIVRGADTADFVEELRQFPNGKNDDMVDAASDAFTEVAKAFEGNELWISI